jgi:hypothetical protein
VPVVVTSEGSAREYFGAHVHYVNHRDPADIWRGIAMALAAGPNAALKAHVTTRFGWPVVTGKLVEIYRIAKQRRLAR